MKLVITLILACWCYSIIASSTPFANSIEGELPPDEEYFEFTRYFQYKKQFNKGFGSLGRFRAFLQNLAAIESFNNDEANTGTYKQGLNHLSDLTHDEYLGTMIMHNATAIDLERDVKGNLTWLTDLDNYEAPPSVDWCSDDLRRVGPVKDQGSCASGWAMAATGLLEGLEIGNRTHEVIPLSAQNLIDCDQYDSGCSGGDVELALKSIQDEGGLNTEQSYPYEGKGTHRCRYNKYDPFVTTMYIKSITNLVSGDETMLQKTVAKYGPVAVGLDASLRSFQNYKSGVYFDGECRTSTINHHMLLVGYGTDESGQDYWKLKNSWSDSWGMSGYMLLARNKNNHCGVATKATIVKISN